MRDAKAYRNAFFAALGFAWMLGDSIADALNNPVLGYLLAVSFFNASICVWLAFVASQGRERNR